MNLMVRITKKFHVEPISISYYNDKQVVTNQVWNNKKLQKRLFVTQSDKALPHSNMYICHSDKGGIYHNKKITTQRYAKLASTSRPYHPTKIIVFILCSFLFFQFSHAQSSYKKIYNKNKTLIAEGWQENGKKIKYWKFYNDNGKLTKQGHFCAGLKCKFWYYYDQNGNIIEKGHYKNNQKTDWWVSYMSKKLIMKTQYKAGKKDGYSIVYKKGRPYKAEKYAAGKKLGEWYDVASFKRDNPGVL